MILISGETCLFKEDIIFYTCIKYCYLPIYSFLSATSALSAESICKKFFNVMSKVKFEKNAPTIYIKFIKTISSFSLKLSKTFVKNNTEPHKLKIQSLSFAWDFYKLDLSLRFRPAYWNYGSRLHQISEKWIKLEN